VNAVRVPVAAGSFYPGLTGALADAVDRLLAGATPPILGGELRALVAPHAGYVYSGAVAASAFALVPRSVARVVLLGPSHFFPLLGAAVTGADAWRTPLGDVMVDRDLRTAAVAAGALVDDEPHRADHALEVQLPFLQRRTAGRLTILPVAFGDDAAAVLSALDALVVVSTDLSHYHDDATARRLDRRTADAVLALDAEAVSDRNACGAAALRVLLRHARGEGWTPTLLDLRTSADATGDYRRVVGYSAFAFTS